MAVYLGKAPERDFGRNPNDWMRDPKLSFKAKGFISYLLGHQHGYALTTEQIIAETADGKDSVYATINEAIRAGYVRRVFQRDARGKIVGTDFFVIGVDGKFPEVMPVSGFPGYGEPGNGPTSDNAESSQVTPISGKPVSGKPVSGKPDPKKTKTKKTKVLEDQEKTTPPTATDQTQASADSGQPQEEEIGQDDNHNAEAQRIASHRADQLDPLTRQRLTRYIATAMRRGWTTADITQTLDAPTAGLTNTAAGIVARARDISTMDPPAAVKEDRPGPCQLHRGNPNWKKCSSCRADWYAGDDSYAGHEHLRPDGWHDAYPPRVH